MRPQRPGVRREFIGIGVPVVDPGDHRPLEAEPAVLDGEVVRAGLGEGIEGVALVDRDELVAEAVVGGVQRHREIDRERLGGEASDAGDDANRRHGEVARRDADVGVQPLDGPPRRRVVRERFAHAHEHDVRHSSGRRRVGGDPGRCDDLFDDLADREVSFEPGLAGGAEAAGHGTPGLGRDAHRGPVGIEHQDRLDGGAVVEAPQELRRVAVVAHRTGDEVERGGEFVVEAGAQGLRQVGQFVGAAQLAIPALPDLVDAVPRLVGEEVGEAGPVDAVARGGRGAHGGHGADGPTAAVGAGSNATSVEWMRNPSRR